MQIHRHQLTTYQEPDTFLNMIIIPVWKQNWSIWMKGQEENFWGGVGDPVGPAHIKHALYHWAAPVDENIKA